MLYCAMKKNCCDTPNSFILFDGQFFVGTICCFVIIGENNSACFEDLIRPLDGPYCIRLLSGPLDGLCCLRSLSGPLKINGLLTLNKRNGLLGPR